MIVCCINVHLIIIIIIPVARYLNVTSSLAFADIHALIVVSTFSINGSNMFSSLSNAALYIRNIVPNSAVSSATSSSIRVSQKPNCGRLAIQGRVQQRRLFLRLCFSISKQVTDSNARRFLFYTFVLAPSCKTLNCIFLGDDGLTAHLDGPWWRVLTGRHDGMCVRVAVLTSRLDGPSGRPVKTARVSQALQYFLFCRALYCGNAHCSRWLSSAWQYDITLFCNCSCVMVVRWQNWGIFRHIMFFLEHFCLYMALCAQYRLHPVVLSR